MKSLKEIAREYYNAGLNVLPASKRQKRPLCKWKEYVSKRPEFAKVFSDSLEFDAIAVVCGASSGGLEVVDFDQKGVLFKAFQDKVGDFSPSKERESEDSKQSATAPFYLKSCVVESTQSGGVHVAYKTTACGRSAKLASTAAGCAIETRGEGGICIIAPTDGYVLRQGSWTNLPTLDKKNRDKLIDAAKSLDAGPGANPVEGGLHSGPTAKPDLTGRENPPLRSPSCVSRRDLPAEDKGRVVRADGERVESVADYLRQSNDWRNALLRSGWTYLRDDAKYEYWARPGQPVAGKTGGCYSKDEGYFHVFSTNAAPLEGSATYSPLQLIATLEHRGDVSAASRFYARRLEGPTDRIIEVVHIDDAYYNQIDSFAMQCEGELGANDSHDPTNSASKTNSIKSPLRGPRRAMQCEGDYGANDSHDPTNPGSKTNSIKSPLRGPRRAMQCEGELGANDSHAPTNPASKTNSIKSPLRGPRRADGENLPFDGPEFPKELLECGGLIGELQALRNRYAIRKQPEGAFLGALADMSFLSGRSFAVNYSGTLVTPNIYALFLAPSGMGKEAIRRVGAEIARIYRPNESIPESFASVQALQNMLCRLRKIYWLHDEFGRDLAVMNGERGNSNVTSVITESLKVFSNANNRNYLPRVVAQDAKESNKVVGVDRPSLTIFATGNPKEFFNATSETLLGNGYIARFTVIYGRQYSEKKASTYENATSELPFVIPRDVQRIVKQWAAVEASTEDGPFVAGFDKAAFDVFKAFDDELEMKIREDTLSGKTGVEFLARCSEKVWKYALLFACSERGGDPSLKIDAKSMGLATKLARYETAVFQLNEDRMGGNDLTRFTEEVLEWARSQPGQMFGKSQFTRRFQRRGSSKEREEVLNTLLDAEYLTDVWIETAGRRKKGFILNE